MRPRSLPLLPWLSLLLPAACAPSPDRGADRAPASPLASPPAAVADAPPPPPAVTVAETTLTATRCVVQGTCADVTLVLPRLALAPGVPGADSAALAASVAALEDTVRALAGVPAGRTLSRHAEALAAALHGELRAQRRLSPSWGAGFTEAVTVRVPWVSSRVLTVEVERTRFAGGAHGQYEAVLRSYDLRTAAPIPVTAMVADTAAIVPLLEAGFARAKADSGAPPPPLRTLLYPEVQRLPVAVDAGIVAAGVQFLYPPYLVAPWSVGRTDVVLTWAQLGALADRRRWGG